MPCRLPDLSPEIQFQIADEIRRDINAAKIEDDEADDPYGCNLEKPYEKQERKQRASGRDRVRDLINCSWALRFFRDLLTPYIFETVTYAILIEAVPMH